MGIGTRGQQSPAADYSAKRHVNGACGISGNNSCTAAIFSGRGSSTNKTINVYFTINSMTTTTINYQITSITYNDGTSVTYPYTFPKNKPIVNLTVQNANAPSNINANPSFNFPTTINSNPANTQLSATFFYLPNATTFSVLSSGICYAYVSWWTNTYMNPLLNNNVNSSSGSYYQFTI
jgi:hypothetical protein